MAQSQVVGDSVDARRAAVPAGLLVFLLVTFGLAWAIELGPVRALGLKTMSPVVTLLMVGVMLCPTVGAILARLVERKGFGDAGLRWGMGRYHLVAWLLPVAISLVATCISVWGGLGSWDPGCEEALARVPPEQAAAAAQMRDQMGALFPVVCMLSALFAAVSINSLATFGEEFGWRGYLQMRLEQFGTWQSMVFTGLIWGVWHAPVILQGHNYPQHPVAGAIMFVPFCVLLSFILGWLRNASGSVLAPTIGHASLNGPAASLMAFTSGVHPLLGNLLGAVGMGVMGLFVLWLALTGRLNARLEAETAGAEAARGLAEPEVAGPSAPSVNQQHESDSE